MERWERMVDKVIRQWHHMTVILGAKPACCAAKMSSVDVFLQSPSTLFENKGPLRQ